MAKVTTTKREAVVTRREKPAKRGTAKRVFREILFPTEPTSIDPARIDRAIELVMARRK